ncbi:hypothetical protein RYX36_024189 [Vicia faba]
MKDTKVLMVGAGGIGCELLKTLALSGFSDIHIIDMDTIEVNPDFDVDFFKEFNVVLNGLENLDARRHVNRMCLVADVSLVESGTNGFLGQNGNLDNGNACSDALSVSAMSSLGIKNPRDVWSPRENSRILLKALKLFLTKREKEIDNLSFDKDDQLAVEFVTIAANIRAASFGIPLHSLIEANGIVGNIVHVVATTNDVIAGLIVIEAIKKLAAYASEAI